MIKNTVYIVMLLALAVEDIRYRSIEVVHLIVMVLIMWIMQRMLGEFDAGNLMIAVAAGVPLLGICIITESMGLADGLILVVTGVFMGCAFACKMLVVSLLFLCIMYTVKYMSGRRAENKTAFIPYLLAGAVGVIVLN